MSDAARIDAPIGIPEFDAWLAIQQADVLAELVDGRIVLMTNPTEDHEQIAGNIGAPLKLAMDAKGCRVYQGGIRIQRSEDDTGPNKPRPDIVVRCGPSGRRGFITDPLVVVEVLSPSTMDIDRGPKLAFYKTLPTLRHIVLVYQDQMRAEHYRPTDAGWSEPEVLTHPADLLCLDAVGFELALERAYFGVDVSTVRPFGR